MARIESRHGIAAVVLALAIGVPCGRAAADPVGFIAALDGTVEIRAAGGSSWEAALLDRNVEIGDFVRTGSDAGVKIVLADDTILTIGEETELELDSLLVGDAATQAPSVLRLLKGKARAVVGERFGGPTRIEVHTPTAVVGVKGTAFDVFVLEDATNRLRTLACNLHGSIFVRHTTRPRVVEPRPGLCAEVFPDAGPDDEVPRPDWAHPPVDPSPAPLPAFAPDPSGGALPPVGGGGPGDELKGDGDTGFGYLEPGDAPLLDEPIGGSSPFPGGNVQEPDTPLPGGGVNEP